MPDEKLDALMAELRAMELWDRLQAEAAPECEIDRIGFEARRMRRVEIMREIDALLTNHIEILRNAGAAGRFVRGLDCIDHCYGIVFSLFLKTRRTNQKHNQEEAG